MSSFWFLMPRTPIASEAATTNCNVQKSRHLVKPMVICASDGYIVGIFGPYEARENDASIMRQIMNNDPELYDLLQDNDHFLVDRGFRDVSEELVDDFHFNVHIPTCYPEDKKQLTTREANESRLVTKGRWIVEQRNGLLKMKFPVLNQVDNNMLFHILDDYKIGAALINCFGKVVISDKDNGPAIAERMLLKLKENKNPLIKLYKANELHKKSKFEKLTVSSISDFPRLGREAIQSEITFGSYQLEQGMGYLTEHNSEKGSIQILICSEKYPKSSRSKIVRADFRSRHSDASKYRLLIKYRPNAKTSAGIEWWYCTCRSGARTVGCCSHIAGLILYLSCQLTDLKPSSRLQSIFEKYDDVESDDDECIEESADCEDDDDECDESEDEIEEIEIKTTKSQPRKYQALASSNSQPHLPLIKPHKPAKSTTQIPQQSEQQQPKQQSSRNRLAHIPPYPVLPKVHILQASLPSNKPAPSDKNSRFRHGNTDAFQYSRKLSDEEIKKRAEESANPRTNPWHVANRLFTLDLPQNEIPIYKHQMAALVSASSGVGAWLSDTIIDSAMRILAGLQLHKSVYILDPGVATTFA